MRLRLCLITLLEFCLFWLNFICTNLFLSRKIPLETLRLYGTESHFSSVFVQENEG